MAKSINQEIRDDLVAHDVDVRKVDAGVRRRVEKRLDELSSDLKALTVKIDPHGTRGRKTRARRLTRLRLEAREIIKETYEEIDMMTRDSLARVGTIESKAVVEAIARNLP